jgi:branched-subunit amino acid ABC-type transport system permease component
VVEFFQYVVNGLTTGAVYALVGVGLTLGIGVARFFNFAQGQFVVLAGFLGFMFSDLGVPFLLCIPLAIIPVALLGVILRDGINRMSGGDTLVVFLGTLGFGVVLQYSIVLIWGGEQRLIPTPFDGNLNIGGVIIPYTKIALFAISAPVIVALYVLLAKTDAGRRLRACAENTEVPALLGIDVQRTMRISVALGSGLAALAGVLVGTLFPFDAFGGSTLLTKGIAVALAGGLGSVSGAVFCGLALGLVETFATAYGIPLGFYTFGSIWQDGYAFVLMIAVLAWRPRGLFRGTGEL